MKTNTTLRHSASNHNETYYGTKEQLQAVGIGCGLPFPGEAGAPSSRSITIRDAHERKWTIRKRGWEGPGQFYAVRTRPPQERAALERLESARDTLKVSLQKPADVIHFSGASVRTARRFLADAAQGTLIPQTFTAYVLPSDIRRRLSELCDELEALALMISDCEPEPNPAGMREIEKLQSTEALYSNPTFLQVLAAPKAPRNGSARHVMD